MPDVTITKDTPGWEDSDLWKERSGVVVPYKVNSVDPAMLSQEDYTQVSKLTRNERRKLLKDMVKTIPIAKMTYDQAKLYHRLRGRVSK